MADDDLIRTGPDVIAVLALQMVRDAQGNIGLNINGQGDCNEFNLRFMLSKASAVMEDNWRVANAPKVSPVNGMTPALKKYLGIN